MRPRWPMTDQLTRAQCESSAHCGAGAESASAPPSRSTTLHVNVGSFRPRVWDVLRFDVCRVPLVHAVTPIGIKC